MPHIIFLEISSIIVRVLKKIEEKKKFYNTCTRESHHEVGINQ